MAKNQTYIEYPVLLYQNFKGKGFLSFCIVKNIIAFGKTELEALRNIEKNLSDLSDCAFVKAKIINRIKENSNYEP